MLNRPPEDVHISYHSLSFPIILHDILIFQTELSSYNLEKFEEVLNEEKVRNSLLLILEKQKLIPIQ